MDWWVTEGGREPIGPVTTELLLKGIHAGKVPAESLVCEVGGQAWRSLTEVEPFAAAVAQMGRPPRRLDDSIERTLVDVELPLTSSPEASEEPMPLRRFDTIVERTIVEKAPVAPEGPALSRFDEGEDRTIVDIVPRPPE